MISYQSRWLRYVELWFDESCTLNDFDVVFRYRSSAPVPGARNEEFHSLVVDLTKSEQEILSGIHRNTRSKIKRAESEDGLSYEAIRSPSQETLDEFIDYYSEFARSKGVASLDRSRLGHQRSSGALVLSRIRNAEKTLVWHVHQQFEACAVMSHSASLYRERDKDFQSLVGRANRLHHYKDMLYFKSNMCKLYDFGGWYTGTDDRDRLMINRFKGEFGGQRVLQYNAVSNRTWRAKLLKSIRRST